MHESLLWAAYRLTLQLRLALQRAKLVPTCQSSPTLAATLFPPLNVVEQLFAVAPGHFSVLRDDPRYADRAKVFAAKCRDISEGGWCASKALGNGFGVRKSSHERSRFAATREHDRMMVPLANVGRENRKKRKDSAGTQRTPGRAENEKFSTRLLGR
jgi:hypothetical protein